MTLWGGVFFSPYIGDEVERWTKKRGGKRARGISQFFEFIFDVGKLEPDCAVGNLLVVEEKAYAPYGG